METLSKRLATLAMAGWPGQDFWLVFVYQLTRIPELLDRVVHIQTAGDLPRIAVSPDLPPPQIFPRSSCAEWSNSGRTAVGVRDTGRTVS
jgi:hypothetical protein